MSKLKAFKIPLKRLNASKYREVHQKAQAAYQKLLDIQLAIHPDVFNPYLAQKEIKAKEEHNY